jgi:outer membrane murein-binding lipoprotein Lpp
MSHTTSRLRVLTAIALFTSTVLVAGCGSPDKVTKTTTTEQTTATPPVTSSSTTTTTRQTQ